MVKNSKITLQPEWFDLNSLLEIVKSDKKSTGKLTMVLLSDNPFLHDIQDLKPLTQILQTTYESI